MMEVAKSQSNKIMMLIKCHRDTILISLLLVLSLIIRAWYGADANASSQPAKPPVPVVLNQYVTDIYDGNLVFRDSILQKSEVSLVIYYAPWCSNSIEALKHFQNVSKAFHQQISFIAVNCWWSIGECRKMSKIVHFPQIYIHHRLAKHPIYYNGPRTSNFLSAFVHETLNSVTYLGSEKDAYKFLSGVQTSVIGYFDLKKGDLSTFMTFTAASLSLQEEYPAHHTRLAIVTNKRLAAKFGLNNGHIKKYDRLYRDFEAVDAMDMTSASSDDTVKWIERNQAQVLTRLFSSGKKMNDLYKTLKKGPTLLAFVSNTEQIEVIERIAIKYHDRCHPWSPCLSIKQGGRVCSICTLYDGYRPNNPNSIKLMRNLIGQKNLEYFLSKTDADCLETRSQYDTGRTRVEVCCRTAQLNSHRDINGLAWKSNRTVQFVVAHRGYLDAFAGSFGSNEAIIIDLMNEDDYVMSDKLTADSLKTFILRFTNGRLSPWRWQHLTSSSDDTSKSNVRSSRHNSDIPRVEAGSFNDTVLHSSEDVLLYYTARWCGFCATSSHVMSTFRRFVGNIEHLKILTVDDKVNSKLPVPFAALRFPTIILFPANRTWDSVLFSPSSKISLPNLVEFLLRFASPATKMDLITTSLTNASSLEIERNGFCLNDQQRALRQRTNHKTTTSESLVS